MLRPVHAVGIASIVDVVVIIIVTDLLNLQITVPWAKCIAYKCMICILYACV